MAGEQVQPRRWQSLRDAAAASVAQGTGERQGAAGPALAGLPAAARPVAAPPEAAVTGLTRRFAALRGRLEDARLAVVQRRSTGARKRRPGQSPERRHRTDLRLVPAALLVWGTALATGWLEPVAIAVLCVGLAAAAVLLLLPFRQSRAAGRGGRGGKGVGNRTAGRGGKGTVRSFRATLATALVLSVAAAAHAAVASAQRHDDALVQAVTNRASVVAEVEVEDQPRQLAVPGRSGEPDRWAVPAVLQVLVFDGRRVEARAAILVLGGAEWGGAEAGERFRIAGRLKPAAAGEAEAAMLSVTANPVRLSVKNGREPEWSPDWESGRDSGSQLAPGKLRSSFAAAAEALPGDARGLLPGMVTGDTAALDPELAAAMRVVGMTHLTAVSGANCSLVLGALLLAARSLRLPRPVAAVLALAGLGLFVLMVGPEPSVLRAACMGAIGLSALTAGRSGRGLSLLCVTSIGLLLADPALAADFGFLLSVLATLGIIVAGRPIMEWLPAVVPRAVAAALAVPLSAQVFCGPVIVLLQPQFSSYSLAANLASGALVAPVTLLGTLAVPLVPWAPALAAVPVTTAGAFASGVAGIARYFAALPGAALPWPEGAVGAVTMAVFSALTLAAVWLATHRAAAWDRALELHAGTTRRLDAMLDRGIRRTDREPAPSRRGLVDRSRRGRLRVCKPTFRRNHQWLLPNPNAPGPRRRTPPPGAT